MRPDVRSDTNIFDSEDFIFSLSNSPQDIKLEKNIKILNRLCKKIDVQKKLCRVYKKDLSSSIDDTPVSQKTLVLLLSIYLNIAQRDKNIKFLNTALKILDTGDKFPDFLHMKADDLVEKLI